MNFHSGVTSLWCARPWSLGNSPSTNTNVTSCWLAVSSQRIFSPCRNTFLTKLIFLSSVGYDSEHMKLSGRYSYYRFAGIYSKRQRSKNDNLISKTDLMWRGTCRSQCLINLISRENQRTLPFNVDIKDLPPHKRVFVGSSSKFN